MICNPRLIPVHEETQAMYKCSCVSLNDSFFEDDSIAKPDVNTRQESKILTSFDVWFYDTRPTLFLFPLSLSVSCSFLSAGGAMKRKRGKSHPNALPQPEIPNLKTRRVFATIRAQQSHGHFSSHARPDALLY